MRVAIVVAVALVSSDVFAGSYLQSDQALVRFSLGASGQGDASVDVIRTKDGLLHVGRIVDRVPTGYLFRSEQEGTTYVIEYQAVDDVKSTTAAVPPAVTPSVNAEAARDLIAATDADIKRLEEEFSDAGLVSPIVKIALGAISFGLTPVALRYANDALPLTLLVVAGAAFLITGGIQLILRIGARARIEEQLAERRTYREKVASWGQLEAPR